MDERESAFQPRVGNWPSRRRPANDPHPRPRGSVRGRIPDRQSSPATLRATDRACNALLREGNPIGAVAIRRIEVRPFTDKQIALLKTFADQAVIAIENARLFQGLTESLEQQTATSEILRVIASSPTDIQPVLDVVAENAARLCDAKDTQILRVDGDLLRVVASFGQLKAFAEDEVRPITRGYVTGRAVTDRQTIHLYDLLAEVETEFPEAKVLQQRGGHRTTLATPLLREGIAIGAILILRGEVRPFTDKQIALLKTFADQAVIAIENVRLFKELDHRNRQLTEALEQQTATGEVLRVIASSPTELQPVLDTLIANAVRLSGATKGHVRQFDGHFHRVVANYGESPETVAVYSANPLPASADTPIGRAILERRPVHILDVQLDKGEHVSLARMTGARTLLAVPLFREGTPVGGIIIWRDFVEPFTERQIELVKTFADQAVIAIENVRLFKELQERNRDLTQALEQQMATSEILRVIASSPTDIQPVLDVVAENAARLCDAADAVISRVDSEHYSRTMASYGSIPVPREIVQASALTRGTPAGRAFLDRKTIHVHDLAAELETEFTESKTRQQVSGSRTILATPMLREGVAIGTMVIRRTEVRPFTEKQIKLLETFADQAIIAIENVRLFQELQARNRDLTEALEQQTATGEILRVIASSPTDIQPVLNAVAENATRLCDAKDVSIGLVEGDVLKVVASYGMMARWWPDEGVPINRGSVTGRTIVDRQPIHVHDLASESDEEFPLGKIYQKRGGHRTNLGIPLLREGVPIGVIAIRRMEIRPFSDKQIALLKTFADQAVIAIENVRLFKELEERNAELREALEHQTATAEVLGIISRSPTDVQPVLDAIVESAARVCGIDDVLLRLNENDSLVPRAHFGPIPTIGRVEISLDEPQFRWMREHGALHVPDLREQKEFPMFGSGGIARTLLAVPLRQKGEFVGTLMARRGEVRPFTPTQIKLLETFADQAVIAIENVRLFQELKESLEQQTATSEILGVIASSPTDIQPVLDVVAENAARLCEATER